MVPENGGGSVRPKQTAYTTGKKLQAAFTDSFCDDSDSDSAGGAFIPQVWEEKRRVCQERHDCRRRKKKEDKERRRAMSETLFSSGQQGTLQSAPLRTEFVFHLYCYTTVQKVRIFIKEKNIDVGSIEYRSRRNDRYKSVFCCCTCSQRQIKRDNEESNLAMSVLDANFIKENSDTLWLKVKHLISKLQHITAKGIIITNCMCLICLPKSIGGMKKT